MELGTSSIVRLMSGIRHLILRACGSQSRIMVIGFLVDLPRTLHFVGIRVIRVEGFGSARQKAV